MSHHFTPTRLAQAACLTLGAFALSGAHASDTPLTLTASETLTYDSNILKKDSDKRRDLYSSTGVKAALDKNYGRQNYRVSAQAIATRYKNTDLFNNDGYNLAAGFSTELASDWSLSLDHSRTRQLQPLEDQGLNRYKEIVTSISTNFYVNYGLHGRWSTNLSLSDSKSLYDINDILDKNSQNVRIGLRYSPTDLLYFDGGIGQTKSNAPKYPIRSFTGDPVDREDADLNVNWVVTGFSNLRARLGWTQEKHINDEARNFNGLTGSGTWRYTPAGKVSYTLAIDRDTNNAGGQSAFFIREVDGQTQVGYAPQAQNRVTTSISGAAYWQATSKITVNTSLTYRQLKESFRASDSVPLEKQVGNYRSLGLGVTYALTRMSSLSCDIESYKRTQSLFSQAFTGETLSCSAAISIQP